jgi:L-iditol 2-dehydrogenase
MLALVKTKKGDGNIELQEVDEPTFGPDEVLIKVKACGICGTDIHVMHDEFPYWPPVIMGHEFSGEVEQVGENVKNIKVGDRVVGEPHTLACGKCYLCRRAMIQICPEKRSIGWGIDGAFTKYLKMPERLLHKIPDSMTFEEAAVVEPTANVVHDVLERGKLDASDFVVVLGPGPIGLISAMAVKAAGAREVMITGVTADEPLRLKKARELGIDHVVNIDEEDPVKKVMELTECLGADLIVEASGALTAPNLAVELVRKRGRITVIGMNGKDDISFAWDKAIFKACDIIFNLSTSYTSWDRALSLIYTGKVDVKSIITHIEPLSNWEGVFRDVEDKKTIKAVLIPE